MAFDQTTRNRLQRFVNDVRRVLEEEFTRQLQNDYGMDPNAGSVADLANLRHINDAQRETARILRDTLAHYTASGDMSASQGLDRIVREQAFTVLNRLAALHMAEARGLLVESVGNGFQSKGFELYARLAGAGLGETGDAYRVYLSSVFDELAQDLPGLFDRYSPQGRLWFNATSGQTPLREHCQYLLVNAVGSRQWAVISVRKAVGGKTLRLLFTAIRLLPTAF